MPTPYDSVQSQYEALFGSHGNYFAPGDLNRARIALQQAVNAGIDPSVLQSQLQNLRGSVDYANTRIAQGFDKSASDTVSQQFGSNVSQLEKVSQGAMRAQQAGLDPAQAAGVLKDINTKVGNQAFEEMLGRQAQLNQQNQQLGAFRNQLGTQYFGNPNATLQEALTSTSGDIGNLNQFLGEQQSRTFQRDLAPLINMQMGARGLQDSGANIELQSKALGQLEQSRQQSLMQAALGARQQIAGLGREDILGDIGARQQSLTDAFGLQRAGITMQFQQQLEDQREKLARELAARNGGGPGTLQQVLGGVGMAGSIAAAPFTGGASLAALPAFASYRFGPQAGMLGAGGAGMGQGFFRDDRSSMSMPQTGTANHGQIQWGNSPFGDYIPGYGYGGPSYRS